MKEISEFLKKTIESNDSREVQALCTLLHLALEALEFSNISLHHTLTEPDPLTAARLGITCIDHCIYGMQDVVRINSRGRLHVVVNTAEKNVPREREQADRAPLRLFRPSTDK